MPMPDQLRTVVQRMIDAGEPEEHIAAVIRRFKTSESLPIPLGATGLPRVSSNLSDSGDGLSPLNRFVGSFANNSMLQRAAHPETLGDIGQLLLPNGAEQILSRMVAPAAAAASKYGGAAIDTLTGLLPKTAQKGIEVLRELNPSSWNSPLTAAGRDARATSAAVTRGADMYTMPRGQSAPNVATSRVPYGHGDVPPVSDEDRISALVDQAVAEGQLRRGTPEPRRSRVQGLSRSGSPPAAQAPAPESPSTPPPASAESTPASLQTAAEKRGRRNAPTPRTRGATTPTASESQASGEITLTREEGRQAQKWLEAGVPPDTVAERILHSRTLTKQFGTPTPDQAAQAVADRNASGRWPE